MFGLFGPKAAGEAPEVMPEERRWCSYCRTFVKAAEDDERQLCPDCGLETEE